MPADKEYMEAYSYHLPEERIARFPLRPRDSSKLLVWKNGHIEHRIFRDLDCEIPGGHLLVFNDTRVIPARLHFKKPGGALIETFLLEPVWPYRDVERALKAPSPVVWHCLIGNRKRWNRALSLAARPGEMHGGNTLLASWEDIARDHVRFSWEGDLSFSEVLANFGQTPLPPYLHRNAVESDAPNYQTVYARHEGAVAAPTAGLHFTPEVLNRLMKNGVRTANLTLHVGAGTFRPVVERDYRNHRMHVEEVAIDLKLIDLLARNKSGIVAVGTTSLRTLESLYWYGVGILRGDLDEFELPAGYPYSQANTSLPSRSEAFLAILDRMKSRDQTILRGYTGIYIYPGYHFAVCDGLITNFHLPGSSLLLLVAAFTGGAWSEIYRMALKHEYRFLSYGDASLLWREKPQ